MGTTDPPVLDPAQARRLVGILCLRPGERVLHLGHPDAAAARLASYLVGPAGEVVHADPGPAGSGPAATGRLPFPDGEFDAVLISQLAGGVRTEVLAELGRVTRPTGRVAFALTPPAGGNPERVAALVERSGLRGTGVRFEPGTDPEAAPACLVTAFPPLPASHHRVATPLAVGTAAGRERSRRRAGPVLTLLAGAGLAAGLLVASAVAAAGGPAGEPAPAPAAGEPEPVTCGTGGPP